MHEAGSCSCVLVFLANPKVLCDCEQCQQVRAMLGTPTRDHVVYEHVDVLLHPLAVHLSDAIASSFWVRLGTLAQLLIIMPMIAVCSPLGFHLALSELHVGLCPCQQVSLLSDTLMVVGPCGHELFSFRPLAITWGVSANSSSSHTTLSLQQVTLKFMVQRLKLQQICLIGAPTEVKQADLDQALVVASSMSAGLPSHTFAIFGIS